MNSHIHKGLAAASSLAVLLALGACGERMDQRADTAAARTGQAANEASQDTRSAAAEARQETREATSEARQETSQAANEVRQDTRDAAATAGAAVMGAGAAAKEATQDAASSLGQKIDDAQIVTKVKSGLAADKDISALAIDVDSKDGKVTLTGTVPTSDAKKRAAEIVKNTKDVKSVDNKLTVKAG